MCTGARVFANNEIIRSTSSTSGSRTSSDGNGCLTPENLRHQRTKANDKKTNNGDRDQIEMDRNGDQIAQSKENHNRQIAESRMVYAKNEK